MGHLAHSAALLIHSSTWKGLKLTCLCARAGGDCCPLTGVKLDFSGGPVYQPNPELKRQIQGWAALRGVDLTVLQPVETPRSSAVASPPSNRRRQRWQRVCHDVKRLGRILKDNLRSPGGHDSSMQSRV